MSQATNNNKCSKTPSITSLPTYTCKQCSSLFSIHPTQIDSIRKQQHNHNIIPHTKHNQQLAINISKEKQMQCVYVHCSIRSKGLFECCQCSELSFCRNCDMALCKLCRVTLKVLQCVYCHSFICSQQCYASLLKKYFESMHIKHGISVDAHQSMHFFRKLLLAPHLHAAIANISDVNLPFHVCESCQVQNCGCVDWLCCVNCRKYYCVDCEDKILQKCQLEDCQSYTCCHKTQWNANCDYCNRFDNCQLIFCTKGHCNRHIVINREIEFGAINSDNQTDNNDSNDSNDIELTAK